MLLCPGQACGRAILCQVAEGLPPPPSHPPAWTLCPPQSQPQSRQQMSLSHSALLFHTIAPRKSNPPQVGRVKINAWWKVPRGKLIGSPGRFFNHNTLWRPPGLRVFAQGSRLAGGAWGCISPRAHPGPSRGPMPAGALLGRGTEWYEREAWSHRPGSRPASTLPAGCPWVSHFAFLSLSFPFWKIGLSTALPLRDYCGIRDNVCAASGRGSILDEQG